MRRGHAMRGRANTGRTVIDGRIERGICSLEKDLHAFKVALTNEQHEKASLTFKK
jgi:hypothetical protein